MEVSTNSRKPKKNCFETFSFPLNKIEPIEIHQYVKTLPTDSWKLVNELELKETKNVYLSFFKNNFNFRISKKKKYDFKAFEFQEQVKISFLN